MQAIDAQKEHMLQALILIALAAGLMARDAKRRNAGHQRDYP
jgi:hypothetical protein